MRVDIKDGYYFCFEGVPGSGKTTQVNRFVHYLKNEYPGRELVQTREPGGGEIANVIRTLVQATPFNEQMHPICEAYLYAASRAQTLRTVVAPALSRGALVVADRSVFTSMAFQAEGRGLGVDTVMEINKVAVGDMWPHRTVFIDLDPVVALSRTGDKLGDKFESEGSDFFKKVRKAYFNLCRDMPEKMVMVDGSGTVDEVFQRIVHAMFGNIK